MESHFYFDGSIVIGFQCQSAFVLHILYLKYNGGEFINHRMAGHMAKHIERLNGFHITVDYHKLYAAWVHLLWVYTVSMEYSVCQTDGSSLKIINEIRWLSIATHLDVDFTLRCLSI